MRPLETLDLWGALCQDLDNIPENLMICSTIFMFFCNIILWILIFIFITFEYSSSSSVLLHLLIEELQDTDLTFSPI